ncbi:hypothetical protein ACROYT_G035572 [Oculina patagonica]
MAEVERSRIRSVVQPVTHSNSPSTEMARSRSRSRSPYERKKRSKENKENRRKSDDDEGDKVKEYHRRTQQSDSDDETRSYRRKDKSKYDSERRRDRERHERRRRGSEDEDDDDYDDRRRRKREHRSNRRRRDTPSDDERRNKRSPVVRPEKDDTHDSKEKEEAVDAEENSEKTDAPAKKKANPNNPLLTRTGGAYIPPARLKMMQESIEDKSSEAYQRLSWEALKKSINGLVNKVNTSNIGNIVRELFQENIVRGRGVLCQSIMRAQAASPTFTHVYAALVAILNTKFPKNGELLLRRLVLQFRRAYRRNDKAVCLSSTRFIAHLVNQQVAHEILALEVLTLLLHKPTDDSVEVAIGFLKEVGMKLTEVSSRGVHAVFERLRNILHSAEIDKRVQYMIEVMFAIRKDGFKDHVAVPEGLDLVEEEDQITHLLQLEETSNPEDILNVFKFDPNFLENEEKYKEIKRDILGEGDSDESSGDDDDDDEDDDDDDEEGENKDEQKMEIIDHTETNLVALRRTIYLTIQSSLDYEECAHKLLKMQIKPEQMNEFCTMIIDCCSQQRSYEKFFGLLAQRFCQINKVYMEEYIKAFQEQYESIHRLETNKLRNVAKFFAHLLFTDAIPWTVLACIKLNEDDTTSSSRVFIKILFQELAEYMGLPKLNERLKDPFLAEYFEGIFPRDNPRNTRFSINFFTSVGLGGVTDELREHLKNAPKMIMSQKRPGASDSDSDSSGDSSSSEGSSSSEESSSESSESSEESSDDDRKKRHKKKQAAHKSKEKDTRKHKKDKKKR